MNADPWRLNRVEKIEVVVELHAVMPTKPELADARADEIGDAIAAAVNGVGLGVFDQSANVVDWKSEPAPIEDECTVIPERAS